MPTAREPPQNGKRQKVRCCNHATWIKFKHKKRVLSREFIKFQKQPDKQVGAGKHLRLIKEYPLLRNLPRDACFPSVVEREVDSTTSVCHMSGN